MASIVVIDDALKNKVKAILFQATKLRLAGNSEARMGNLQKAADLYYEGLALDPPHCRHLLLSNRSGVLLSLGKAQEAVEDAEEAVRIAPAGFQTAIIRQVSAAVSFDPFQVATIERR
jgi:tetratricopeptide (TPR) repeat protein